MKQAVESKETVFVGLSGGVDSSVAAYLLRERGFSVVGVFIKVWHPSFLHCSWEEERLDAMRVAATLEIPFLTCDAEKIYKKDVADYFIETYRRGETPNPDIMCNTYVKFGAFYDFAKQHGANYIATGHYARTILKGDDRGLYRGKDMNKDQSYFLFNIPKTVLCETLFPIGELNKNEVREIAKKIGLRTASKKDSQGICFLGQVDIPSYLSHYMTLEEGSVIDCESNSVVGTHNGVAMYTIGQRHGFKTQSAPTKPYYIVKKDLGSNTLIVSGSPPVLKKGQTIVLRKANWLSAAPIKGDQLSAQTRYRQHPFQVHVDERTGDAVTLVADEDSSAIDTGQSCVLYTGDRCIGGGIIAQTQL